MLHPYSRYSGLYPEQNFQPKSKENRLPQTAEVHSLAQLKLKKRGPWFTKGGHGSPRKQVLEKDPAPVSLLTSPGWRSILKEILLSSL